jgi:hypothetical protein
MCASSAQVTDKFSIRVSSGVLELGRNKKKIAKEKEREE